MSAETTIINVLALTAGTALGWRFICKYIWTYALCVGALTGVNSMLVFIVNPRPWVALLLIAMGCFAAPMLAARMLTKRWLP
jgi:hypothetical protein